MTSDAQSMTELGTFLARRWSGDDKVMVEFSDKVSTRTRLSEKRIILTSIHKRPGDDFSKYRQFRLDLWYESMRVRFCKEILSKDHAFGFVLDILETVRIEKLGRQIWRGMDNEIIFCHTYRFVHRPPLSKVYGRMRILEAFYQHFMFGAFRGEIQASHFEKVLRASKIAQRAVELAIRDDKPDMLKKNTGKILDILGIDPLQTVPVSLPFVREDIPLNENDITKFLNVVKKNREGDFGRMDSDAILAGDVVSDEYAVIRDEGKKNKKNNAAPQITGIKVPSDAGIDESSIYDVDLINGLKIKFQEWKNGYYETHQRHGEEFDVESYLDGHEPFFADLRRSIKVRVMILLDHSSSISADAVGYKKATLALCEVMAYLGVSFAVYAFSTQSKAIVCWLIKNEESRWNRTHAKRLARIVANGSTPLAHVYQKMIPVLQARRPDIFLTLTDGEPSDAAAVQETIRLLRSQGIRMVALGLGPGTARATTIASNLKRLGYERALAASRLQDIPRRVLGILSTE